MFAPRGKWELRYYSAIGRVLIAHIILANYLALRYYKLMVQNGAKET